MKDLTDSSAASRTMSPDVEARFNQALALRDAGDKVAACEKLSELIDDYPEFSAPYAIKGGLLQESGRANEAVECFRKAVGLKPRLELASQLLFYALQECDRADEAVAEMTRFLAAGGKSDGYDRILAELREDDARAAQGDGSTTFPAPSNADPAN